MIKRITAVINSTLVKCLRARLGAYYKGGIHSGRLQTYHQMLDWGRSVKKFYSIFLQNVVQSCLASPLSTIVRHFDSSLHFHSTPLPVRERADTFLFFKFWFNFKVLEPSIGNSPWVRWTFQPNRINLLGRISNTLFSLWLTNWPDKLERLLLASLSRLMQCNTLPLLAQFVRYEEDKELWIRPQIFFSIFWFEPLTLGFWVERSTTVLQTQSKTEGYYSNMFYSIGATTFSITTFRVMALSETMQKMDSA